ncbi:MAG: LptF/LptG family permease [Bacteroidota bacterium]|nr:LptF/LptG family permease [Bacteroidota bacterium]MDX5431508.1 LptF/LptG family permease [Bacteroidota bacterium]MDX5470232.1 LptF/LptG family permease [Bacteroidota bacterium]
MLKPKKLDIFILKAFIQPFAATFFISVVVLLMQHLWKYIDDLAGKGLEWYVILEFMVYSTANLIPLALPLAILLASIMTFGNLGEKYELVSIKAAGVSLQRALRPLFFLSLALSGFALWFSLEVVPSANLKWGALYYDLLQQKPAFDLKEGVFYNGIEDYSIKIASKDKAGKRINDIVIYDHRSGRGNTAVVLAEYGEITQSEDQRYLIFELYNGVRYEELVEQSDYYQRNQFGTTKFRKQRMVFDLSDFKLTRSNTDLFQDFWRYRKLPELESGIDSLRREIYTREIMGRRTFFQFYHFDDSSDLQAGSLPPMLTLDSLMRPAKKATAISQALSIARSGQGQVQYSRGELMPVKYLMAKYEMVWWQKFTMAVACLVLFFIGAPLGAIVRKGGFGLPVVFAIIFFMIFFVLNMIGEKMVRELVLPSEIGMWLSTFILTPIGFWLTYKSTRDSALFSMDAYLRFFRRFRRKADTPDT